MGYCLSAIPQPHGKLSYRLLAIGYQLSAMECEARLRGLERNNYSKTISPRPGKAKPACAGYSGIIAQRP